MPLTKLNGEQLTPIDWDLKVYLVWVLREVLRIMSGEREMSVIIGEKIYRG